MKTKAIVFKEKQVVAVEEIDLPEPTSDDIVVETEVSGVSVGTERWAFMELRPEITFPNVPGYMGIGKIVWTGDNASKLGYKEGMKVNFFKSRMLSPYDKSWMASHLEKAVVNVTEEDKPGELDIHKVEIVPDGLSPFGASLTGLCAVAMRGIEMACVPAGAKVLVVGLGMIGQYAAQICRLKGASFCVADVDEFRLDIARQLGADWLINPTKQNVSEEAEKIASSGFDIIIDTSSKPEVVNSLFPLLRLRGKMVFQGWYPPPSKLDLNAAQSRMPTCYFPCAHSGIHVSTAMRWVASGELDTESLITHKVSPDQAPEIYSMISENKEKFLGIVFVWRDDE